MKVLLLNPPHLNGESWMREGRCQQVDYWGLLFPPLTLAYLKTQLRNVHDTLVIDAIASKIPPEEALKKIQAFSPALVIMSVSTPTFNSDCLWFAPWLKKELPKVLLGGIGVHVTSLPKESLLAAPSLDFVIKGEPEAVVIDLVDAIKNKRSLNTVPSLCFREGSEIVETKTRDFPVAIDTYAIPDWTDLDLTRYRLPIKGTKFIFISYSRGCAFSCAFCASRPFYGQKVRLRSAQSLLSEIDYHLRRGIRDFFFWAEMINADNNHLLEFLDALVQQGYHKKIRWVCSARVDNIDELLLRKMKQAGCWQIAFGIETGSNQTLAHMQKGGSQTIEVARQAVFWANKAGLVVDGHFILGYPGESSADMNRTIWFACSLPLTFAHFYAPTPFPGSSLYTDQLTNTWEDIAQHKGQKKIIEKAYHRFYFSLFRIWKIGCIVKNFREGLNLLRLVLSLMIKVIIC